MTYGKVFFICCTKEYLPQKSNYETIKMLSHNIRFNKNYLATFVIILVLVCSCDSYKIKVKTKVKRKVENFSDVKGNTLSDHGVNTSDASGRGFFPPGSIFTLGKVLNFFPVGGERECQPTKGYTVARAGICLNPYDCRQRDGKSGGDCAHGLGVCCVFEVTCGGVIQNNLTYFMSPRFPELWTEGKDCNITIDKAYAGIMQLRIDFVHFSIGQPNRSTGECDDDVMILGEQGNQFKICGQNHGQHIYYTLSTASEAKEPGELAGHRQTRLSIRARGSHMPRLWLMRLAQMPLAYSAPHDCLQYFTGRNGTIATFNYAVNGRYLADQQYRACVRKNTGYCAVRYTPCDANSFRIGPGRGILTYSADSSNGPGSANGPGTGFYGPDGSFLVPTGPTAVTTGPVVATPNPAVVPMGTVPYASSTTMDQLTLDTQNDPIQEEGMMPVSEVVQDEETEGSGADPQIESVDVVTPAPSIATRIWRLIWPSWLLGQSSRSRTWGLWSPYAQHYQLEDEKFLYQGYGTFGLNLKGFGRQRCQDRVTISCDNEYFISNTTYISGVCDPHHCGPSFCPGVPADKCHVQSSVTPFAVHVHFGPPSRKGSAEDNIGACLTYTQLPCDS